MVDKYEKELHNELITSSLDGDFDLAGRFYEQLEEYQEQTPIVQNEARVRFGGAPHSVTVNITCPDCGKQLKSQGISFHDSKPDFDEKIMLVIHHNENCPTFKWKLHRLYRKIWWDRWMRFLDNLHFSTSKVDSWSIGSRNRLPKNQFIYRLLKKLFDNSHFCTECRRKLTSSPT